MSDHPDLASPVQPRADHILITATEAMALPAPALWVDTRPGPDYRRGHLPGAISFDNFIHANERTASADLQGLARRWLDMFGEVGIPLEGPVVFYDAGLENRAPRPALMLRALGNPDSHVLRGGYHAWLQAGRPTTKEPATLPGRHLPDRAFDPEVVAGVDDVLEAMGRGSVVLVDVRDDPEYQGRRRLQWNPRLGRIPGAVPLEWTRLLKRLGDSTTATKIDLRSLDEMRAQIEGAGLDPSQEVIIYCQKSHRACNSYLAFRELGFKKLRVYVGSFREWSRRLDLPVEKAGRR